MLSAIAILALAAHSGWLHLKVKKIMATQAEVDALKADLDSRIALITNQIGPQVSVLVTQIDKMIVPGTQSDSVDLTGLRSSMQTLAEALAQLQSTANLPSTAGGLQSAVVDGSGGTSAPTA